MHSEHLHPPPSPQQFAALMDDAKQRATTLRNAAIKDFWSAAARAVRSAWRALKPARPNPRNQHPRENRPCPR